MDISSSEDITATVHLLDTAKQVARVTLNGYNIKPGGPLGFSGALRSFRLDAGDLWDCWQQQAAVLLRDETGREARVRVAALPVEEGGSGFVEFL